MTGAELGKKLAPVKIQLYTKTHQQDVGPVRLDVMYLPVPAPPTTPDNSTAWKLWRRRADTWAIFCIVTFLPWNMDMVCLLQGGYPAFVKWSEKVIKDSEERTGNGTAPETDPMAVVVALVAAVVVVAPAIVVVVAVAVVVAAHSP